MGNLVIQETQMNAFVRRWLHFVYLVAVISFLRRLLLPKVVPGRLERLDLRDAIITIIDVEVHQIGLRLTDLFLELSSCQLSKGVLRKCSLLDWLRLFLLLRPDPCQSVGVLEKVLEMLDVRHLLEL